MEFSILVFLAGGLFLGWALGANDAANVFGTAVGTRMIDLVTVATICSIFVILRAVISGAGTTETLGKLGTITTLPGAFSVAVSAAITVYIMTRWGSQFLLAKQSSEPSSDGTCTADRPLILEP